ncbi:MAG: STAS domain-containing protein [Methylococcales bacterium]|nr:STAS domain-containing protein [Methylococcales bacterium]
MQTVNIEGEMTISTAAKQKKLLLALIVKSTHKLVINLSQVSELDIAGAQLLILLKLEAARAHKNVGFVMPSNAVLDVLALGNLTALFVDLLCLNDEEELSI